MQLADGRSIPADLVVLAIGIRPNIDLAQRRRELEVNRGIVVDDDMRTSDPEIFAVGECVEHRGQSSAWWRRMWDQAKVCAAQLAGDETAAFEAESALATSLKITGVDVFSAGALMAADEGDDEITLRDDSRGLYKKIVLRDGKLVGAVLYGDVADGQWYLQADARQGRCQRACASGWSSAAPSPKPVPASRPAPDFAAMPDDAQICGCNGVVKGTIVAAIQRQEAHLPVGSACPHQGVRLLRPMHRPGGGFARISRRAVDAKAAKKTCATAPDAGHDEVRQGDRRAEAQDACRPCARRSAGRSRTAATNAGRR